MVNGGFRLNGHYYDYSTSRGYHFDAALGYVWGSGCACPIAAGASFSGPWTVVQNGWPGHVNLTSWTSTIMDTSQLNSGSKLYPGGLEFLPYLTCLNKYGATFVSFYRTNAVQTYTGIIAQSGGAFDVHGQFWYAANGVTSSFNGALAAPSQTFCFNPPCSPPYTQPIWYPSSSTTYYYLCGIYSFLANSQDGYINFQQYTVTFYLDQNVIPNSSQNLKSETIKPTIWTEHFGTYIYFQTTAATGGPYTFYGVYTNNGINGHYQDQSGNAYAWDATSSNLYPCVTPGR